MQEKAPQKKCDKCTRIVAVRHARLRRRTNKTISFLGKRRTSDGMLRTSVCRYSHHLQQQSQLYWVSGRKSKSYVKSVALCSGPTLAVCDKNVTTRSVPALIASKPTFLSWRPRTGRAHVVRALSRRRIGGFGVFKHYTLVVMAGTARTVQADASVG